MSTITASAEGALGLANRRRSAVACVRRRVRARELTVTGLVLDPPGELERYLTWEVLLWAPCFGRKRLRALNARALRHGNVRSSRPLVRSPRPWSWRLICPSVPGSSPSSSSRLT